MTAPTISQILREMGADPGKWEDAGVREQIMICPFRGHEIEVM